MTGPRQWLADPVVVRRVQVVALLVLLVLAAWFPTYYPPYRVFQVTNGLILAIAILGLGLLTGYNGQISLGHGAFYGIGAYTAAILMVNGWPYGLTVVPAAALTFVLGLALGIPALRLRGLYLALVTLGLAVVVPPVVKRFEDLTGGSQGLSVDRPSAPAWTGLADDQWLYYLVLLAAVVLFGAAWSIVHSRIGRAMVAVRDDEVAAETMGIDLSRIKVLTFAWSAMYAGIAGVFSVWLIGFVAPSSFTIVLSIELLAALVVGGLASIVGPLLGAAFLVIVPNVATEISQGAPGLAFGALLIIVMLVAPFGLAGLLRRGWARLLQRPADDRAAPGATLTPGSEPVPDRTPT